MIRLAFFLSLFLTFIALSLIYVNFPSSGNALIIRLDTLHQISFLGNRNEVIRFGLMGFFLILFNIFLARVLEKNYLTVAKLLAWANLLVALLILTVISGIIFIN